jgi:hypothetical protein
MLARPLATTNTTPHASNGLGTTPALGVGDSTPSYPAGTTDSIGCGCPDSGQGASCGLVFRLPPRRRHAEAYPNTSPITEPISL